METTAFYQEFLGRHGLRWFAGIGFVAGEDLWCVAIQRRVAQGPFEPAEVRRLATLWRPLSDAATLSRQLGFARVLGMADALELVSHAAILLDHLGRIMTLNDSALSLVGDMIDVVGQTLAFRDPRSQSRFGSLLANALSDELLEAAAQPAAAVVLDRAGRRLVLRAVVLRGWARFSFSKARVLLLLKRENETPPEPTALLRAGFGLTGAETRLAVELLSGASLAAAAERCGITYETARSRLKSLFSKTGTHHQGELIALIARLGAG